MITTAELTMALLFFGFAFFTGLIMKEVNNMIWWWIAAGNIPALIFGLYCMLSILL